MNPGRQARCLQITTIEKLSIYKNLHTFDFLVKSDFESTISGQGCSHDAYVVPRGPYVAPRIITDESRAGHAVMMAIAKY